jgi:glycosyltransferase involved in cell wall biosynthesis
VTPAKVLYVIQNRDVSGAETMHSELLRSDPDALVACPVGSEAEAFAQDLGAATVDLPFRPLRHSGGAEEMLRSIGRGLGTSVLLRRILRRHRDRRVVFATSLRPAMLSSLAAVGLRRRVIWCVPDFMPPGVLKPATRALARFAAARALCLSNATAADFAGSSRRLREVAAVVNPGVDPAGFDPDAADPGAPVGAIVGHVSPTKRTAMALDVASLVAAEMPGFRLRVIGAAQFRDEDFALERELHERVGADPALAEAVEFTGRTGDVAGALAGAGMLLHCRPDEPFGIALIEAMALGLPVVAPAAAGPLEIVEHGVTGLLYEPGETGAAADAVLRLLRDRDYATRLGATARERVSERFDVDRQLAATRRLIAEAAA